VLAGAGRVRQVMGETGIRILVRIMGLLLVALAMQFFVNGLTDLGLIPHWHVVCEAAVDGVVEPTEIRSETAFHRKRGFPQLALAFVTDCGLLFSGSCN
jgi:hypothetical protein